MPDADPPHFTVVIPVRGHTDALEVTVRSVLEGDEPDFELIVVDDGSPEPAAAALAGIDDPRLSVLRQANAGPGAARNRGARAGRGEVLVFLDNEDRARPRWLATFRRLLADGADVGFAAAEAVRADGTREVVRPRAADVADPPFGDVTGPMAPGCWAVRRTLFEQAGGYAEPLRFSENTELGLRFAAALETSGGRVVATDEVVVDHAIPPGQSRATSALARYDSAIYIVEHHADRLRRRRTTLPDYLGIAGVAAARLGRFAEARRLFARALAEGHDPRNLGRWAVAAVPPVARRQWPPDGA